MRIEVMLDWSLHVVPIVLCGYKVILMILLSTAKQVLLATWESLPFSSLLLPCLLLPAFVLHSLLHNPRVSQRFLGKALF